MTQLDLFTEPPVSLLRWDTPSEAPAYDELVRRNFKGFEYILYDFRLGETWHRVIETTTRYHSHCLAVSSYREPNEVCDPKLMTLEACWHFSVSATPNQVASAIAGGEVPDWTRLNGPRVPRSIASYGR